MVKNVLIIPLYNKKETQIFTLFFHNWRNESLIKTNFNRDKIVGCGADTAALSKWLNILWILCLNIISI